MVEDQFNTADRQIIVALLYPGCIFFELALALELLSKKFRIVFATPDGSDHYASNGSVLGATIPYNAIDLLNCAAILVPGGDPRSIKDNTDVDDLIQTANRNGVLIAAICAGPSILAKANILKGKRIAHGYDPSQLEFLKSYFEGVDLTDEKLIIDGDIITAKPSAHIDFAVEIATHLNAIDSASTVQTKNYYKGITEPMIRPIALA